MNGIPLRKVAIACALALIGVGPLAAQQEAQPGVYSHTIEGETYLGNDSQSLNLPEGTSGFANENEVKELDIIPPILSNDRSLAPGAADELRSCGVYAGSNAALSDLPLQSDFERFDRQILDEIDRFLSEGYPPASVLLHAASMGISIDRALFAAVRSQPERTDELYMSALELMAFLPGWTCTAGVDRGQYDPVYDVNDLPEARQVRDVADRYFDDRSRLAQFPDWPHDEFHILASADELLDLLEERQTDYWYRPGPVQEGPGANPRESVLIGLYPETENGENGANAENDNGEGEDGSIPDGRIVIDRSIDQIRQWKAEGRERIPVTFFYNFEYQRAISQYDDDATLEDIMEAFFQEGEELTPVPLFTVGDHHMEVPAEELQELFEIPEADEIDPVRYQELADDLAANGFGKKPVLVTLLRSGSYSRLAEADRIRVAMEQGVDQFPVAMFYHRVGREPCGAPAICFERICDALVCAGGDPNVCLDPAAAGAIRESFEVPPGGGGGSPASPS